MKKVGFVNISKNGNLYFKLNGKLYIITPREKDDIGSGNNYSAYILLEGKINKNYSKK